MLKIFKHFTNTYAKKLPSLITHLRSFIFRFHKFENHSYKKGFYLFNKPQQELGEQLLLNTQFLNAWFWHHDDVSSGDSIIKNEAHVTRTCTRPKRLEKKLHDCSKRFNKIFPANSGGSLPMFAYFFAKYMRQMHSRAAFFQHLARDQKPRAKKGKYIQLKRK